MKRGIAKKCVPKIRSRRVENPYGPGKVEERSLWCTTCKVNMGGQVASANSTGHRYAQIQVEQSWKKHVRSMAQKRSPIYRASKRKKGN